MIKMILILIAILTTLSSCQRDEAKEPTGETEILYTMPDESEAHEGTWLQWPHHYQYGMAYRNSLDATWVSMVKELVSSEKYPDVFRVSTRAKNKVIQK